MASFRTLRQVQSKALEKSSLLYVHCVSEVDMKIVIINLECVELLCREVHVSFINNLAGRRVCRCVIKCPSSIRHVGGSE